MTSYWEAQGRGMERQEHGDSSSGWEVLCWAACGLFSPGNRLDLNQLPLNTLTGKRGVQKCEMEHQ